MHIYLSKLNTSAVEYNQRPAEDFTAMSMSAAAASSNDTVANSIAQELVCSGKITYNKINSILKILIERLIEINYFLRNAALQKEIILHHGVSKKR